MPRICRRRRGPARGTRRAANSARALGARLHRAQHAIAHLRRRHAAQPVAGARRACASGAARQVRCQISRFRSVHSSVFMVAPAGEVLVEHAVEDRAVRSSARVSEPAPRRWSSKKVAQLAAQPRAGAEAGSRPCAARGRASSGRAAWRRIHLVARPRTRCSSGSAETNSDQAVVEERRARLERRRHRHAVGALEHVVGQPARLVEVQRAAQAARARDRRRREAGVLRARRRLRLFPGDCSSR